MIWKIEIIHQIVKAEAVLLKKEIRESSFDTTIDF